MLKFAPSAETVDVQPPTVDRDSRTNVSNPDRARYEAQIRPLWPAPMTITSASATVSLSDPYGRTWHTPHTDQTIFDQAK